ncbi:MAG: hypothetical protein V4525_07300 [Pseudomonadota bacterium]
MIRLLRMFPPGKTLWLVGWQLLLIWRNLAHHRWARSWIFLSVFALSQYMAFSMVKYWMRFPNVFIWSALAGLMLVVAGACFSRTIQTLLRYLSQPNMLKQYFLAPLSHKVLGRSSVLNIALYSTLYMGFFYMPLAIALIFYGQPAGFAFFIWLPSFALLFTLLGLAVVVGSFKLFGASQARRFFQFLGSGASVLLLSLAVIPVLKPTFVQLAWQVIEQSIVSEGWWKQTGWLQSMMRLALGDRVSLGVLVSIVTLFFIMTDCYWGEQLFVMQQQLLGKMKSHNRALLKRFNENNIQVLFLKEWRMLRRDPRISSEILLDAAQVLPLILVGVYNTKNLEMISLLCLGWVVLGSLMASRLCWLSMSVESGAPWYTMAPYVRWTLRDSKWGVIVTPFVLVTVILALITAAVAGLKVACSFLGIATTTIVLSSRIQLWMTLPLASVQGFYQRLPRSPLAEIISIFFIYGSTFLYVLTLIWRVNWAWWGVIPLGILVGAAYFFRISLAPSSKS